MGIRRDKIVKFYDDFAEKQIKTGVNLRHRSIFLFLVKSGLKRNHHVLEIGCGIGSITGLISSYLTKGLVTAVDISPASIEYARKKYASRQNIRFLNGDVQVVEPEMQFDFFVLPDVLEHIPSNEHAQLFNKLHKHCKENSIVFIHIPSYHYNDYLQHHQPEVMQIIDQALPPSWVISQAENAGFILRHFETYSLSIAEGDYQRYIFTVLQPMEKATKHRYISMVFKELQSKISTLFKQI